MSMHLAIDAAGTRIGGAATVLHHVIEAALRSEALRKITVFTTPCENKTYSLPESSRLREVYFRRGDWVSRVYWQLWGFSRAVRPMGADAVLFLGNGGVAPRGVPAAVFVHQSLPFSGRAMACFGLKEKIRLNTIRWVIAHSSARAERIAVQSATMKSWLSQQLAIDEEKILAFPPSIEPLPESRDETLLLKAMRDAPEGSRVLYVGNTRPYKNVECLVATVRLARLSGMDVRLFLTAPPSHPLCSEPHVTGLGIIPRNSLLEMYRLADLLVMPSLVETVGLPMLEAAASGTPVLAADFPYAHDACGGAAVYFRPEDPGDMAEKMTEILADGNLRQEMVLRGRKVVAARNDDRPYDRMIEMLVDMAAGKQR